MHVWSVAVESVTTSTGAPPTTVEQVTATTLSTAVGEGGGDGFLGAC